MGIELGTNINNEAKAITMHSTHRNTNPPIMIPVHAIGRPDSLYFRILFNEIVPKVIARIPNIKLVGKQIIPVNGSGISPAQKDRMVNIPKRRLRMDWELRGGEAVSSFEFMGTASV